MNRLELLRRNDIPQEGTNLREINVFDWHACDVENDGDGDGDGDGEGEGEGECKESSSYRIYGFGVCRNGQSACIEITDFPAYFFVKWVSGWGDGNGHADGRAEAERYTLRLQRYLSENMRGLTSAKIHMRKDYWGFSNDREVPFIQLAFGNLRDMRKASYALAKNQTSNYEYLPKDMRVKVYESKIDPLLRFMHISGVKPVGWVTVPARAWIPAYTVANKTTCQHYAKCHFREVAAITDDSHGIAPLVIASFDIECTSSHGDFPVARKDYTRLAMELETLWDYEHLGDQDEYSIKGRLVQAIDYAMSYGDLEIREDASNRLLVSRLLLKETPEKGERVRAAIRRAVDEVYGALRNRQQQATSSSEDVPSVIQALANVLNQALGTSWLVEGDPIIQIGTTLGVYGSAHGHCSTRVIYTLGSCTNSGPSDGIIVREFEREDAMLMAWLELVRDLDPDVLTGYNILGFDIAYIYERACELGLPSSRFLRFGRINELQSAYTELQLSSSALGDNILKYFAMHGRVYIDLLKVVQRDHKLDSYKLDSVAEHFLGERKNDVSPNDIFRLQRGSADDRRIIADYCVQDCELCNRLLAKLETIANSVGMANVCIVPLSFIFMRGQGIKIFSLVAKHCRDAKFLIPDVQKPPDSVAAVPGVVQEDDGYEGAIVLEPVRGMHLDTPVSVLDYSSLYPSSMISHNISHNSIVLDEKYANVPGVEYVSVSYDVLDTNKNVIGVRECRYATTTSGGAPYEGVLPRILKDLLSQRKATRKLAEAYQASGDMFRYALCDGQQLAYKITANSLYGQMGARTSKLYLKDIAACTTSVGRSMIITAKKYVEDEYDARVVYGDSVAGYTPVPLRIGGEGGWVTIDTVERAVERFGHPRGWVACVEEGRQSKEAIELVDVETWSDEGWTAAHRVIRHALAPHKRMVRVITDTGIVDVTDDHSLLRPDGSPVKPTELVVGETALLHADLPPAIAMHSATFECGADWIDQRTQLRAARIFASGAAAGNRMSVEAVSDGKAFRVRIGRWPAHRGLATVGNGVAQRAFGVAGNSVAQCASDNRNVVRHVVPIVCSECADREASGGALGTGVAYVYDFTTANHKFSAGVGRLVVHNTDSIFVTFPEASPDKHAGSSDPTRDALAASIAAGMRVSDGIKSILPPPHHLEYEKTFFPFVLLSKKRYVGMQYTDDPDGEPKQKSMGIALKRRDSAPIVKKIYGGVIEVVLKKRDIPAAVEFLKDQLFELIRGNYDLQDLVISKTLRSIYKFPRRIPHVVLARRMHDRDPGSEPQVNDRVPYVFVHTRKHGALMGDRIEHIDYVREHPEEATVDTLLYIQSQIMKPCLQLLACALEQLPGYRYLPYLSGREALSALVLEKDGNERKAQTRLDDLREAEVRRMIFEPFTKPLEQEHDARISVDRRQQKNRANKQMEITSFLKNGKETEPL